MYFYYLIKKVVIIRVLYTMSYGVKFSILIYFDDILFKQSH